MGTGSDTVAVQPTASVTAAVGQAVVDAATVYATGLTFTAAGSLLTNDANGDYVSAGFFGDKLYFAHTANGNAFYLWWDGVEWSISDALGNLTNYIWGGGSTIDGTYTDYMSGGRGDTIVTVYKTQA
jgi:hypothetical protein